MNRRGLLLLLPAVALAALAPPPKLYISKDACPFECCVYREWTALNELPVYRKPNGGQIGKLAAGETVQAEAGEVRATPIPRVASRAYDDAGIREGARFWLLHYYG